jgi:hypothetical protein
MKRTFLGFVAATLNAIILLTACHSRRTYYQGPPIEGFRFGAHATLAGPRADTLRVDATAENISDHPLQSEWGACYRLNRLAIVAEANSKTWDSRTWEIRHQPVYHDSLGRAIQMGCAPVAFITTVPSGGLLNYELRIPIKEILADSLGHGRYRIIARIIMNGREIKNLPAGDVEFRPPPT